MAKTRAIPSLHRDSFLAPPAAGYQDSARMLASGNAYYHNRRAVSVHAKKTADRQIDNETNDTNKMKDYKREISLHAFS